LRKQVLTNSIIRGRVFYEGSGLPVKRGLIGLLELEEYLQSSAEKVSFINQQMDPKGFVLTSDEGEFEIRNVKAGSYLPYVRVKNVLNPQSINSFYGNTSTISVNKLEDFFKRINVDGVSEINVLVPVKRGAVISGSVAYADGGPAIGVRVRIFRKGTEIGEDEFVTVDETETDDRGFYRRTEMVPGNYFVEVSEPSDHGVRNEDSKDWRDYTRESELKTYFPGVSERNRAGVVSLDWGLEASNTDIVIPDRKLFKVSGTVVGKDTQRPLSKVRIKFEKLNSEGGVDYYGWDWSNQVASDETGSWAFKDLPPGRYRIKVSPQKYDSYYFDSGTKPDESPYAETVKEFEIGDKNLSGYVVELPLEASISGTIVAEDKGTLPNHVRFHLVDKKRKVVSSHGIAVNKPKDGDRGKKTKVDFRIGSLSVGTYSIQAELGGDGHYIKSIRLKGYDATKRDIEIKEGEEITDVKVTIASDGGNLTGIVYIEKGKPAKLTNILMVPTNEDKQQGDAFYFSGWTNSNGEFTIKAAPGEYFVIAGLRKPEDIKISTDEWILQVARNGEKVRIKPDETTKISLTVVSR